MAGDRTAHQRRVEQFMQKAGQQVPPEPVIPSAEVLLLRAKLIFEEAMETITALGVDVMIPPPINQHDPVALDPAAVAFRNNPRRSPDLIEIADGCADISVVTIGTLSACGIADKPLLEEVDESNLAKFEEGGYRREDGKWMKPPGWKPPDIRQVLWDQQSPVTRAKQELLDENECDE